MDNSNKGYACNQDSNDSMEEGKEDAEDAGYEGDEDSQADGEVN